ncbi:hypothetical protein [Streptomyces lasiicapitis]|uniref:hypothetical protein n=1 Tax=Streptomyces lasiicapitis TaxID=1923961 RepID=UPI00369FFA4C
MSEPRPALAAVEPHTGLAVVARHFTAVVAARACTDAYQLPGSGVTGPPGRLNADGRDSPWRLRGTRGSFGHTDRIALCATGLDTGDGLGIRIESLNTSEDPRPAPGCVCTPALTRLAPSSSPALAVLRVFCGREAFCNVLPPTEAGLTSQPVEPGRADPDAPPAAMVLDAVNAPGPRTHCVVTLTRSRL